MENRKSAAGNPAALCFSAHGTRATSIHVFGAVRFDRGDVIHHTLRPAINVRPVIAIANAMLVRRNVHDHNFLYPLTSSSETNGRIFAK
jgi:hypothetical protein